MSERRTIEDCEAEVAHLRTAVTSRDLIGMAKGILIATDGCRATEAFDVLRRASQRENRKLRDVAGELIAAHEAQPVAEDPPPPAPAPAG